MNYDRVRKEKLTSRGSLKARPSEKKSLVKRPHHKNRPKKKVKEISVAYTLKNNIMPYGMYKNWKIRDLPTDYILWAILNLDESSHNVVKDVLEALAAEMARRDPSLLQ
jgi:hypothetical protein